MLNKNMEIKNPNTLIHRPWIHRPWIHRPYLKKKVVLVLRESKFLFLKI